MFLNYFETLDLSVFPFVMLSMLFTGGLRVIQMTIAYIGGMGGVILCRLALAITHDFFTNVTSKNLSEKVMGMASNFVNGAGVNTIYDQSYFNYLVERSGMLGIASTSSVTIITFVITTGTVAVISKIASGHAQSIASQVQDASVLKAQKVDSMVQQKMAESTGIDPMDMKLKQDLMKGIEQNNAAYLDMQKYNQAQQYSAGQIAQGTSQIASMTTTGQDAITNGLGHARALGTDQAIKQINAAKGMMSAGVYDSSGNLKEGSQADLYQKGLENQSRIGANKTIGVGKEDLSGQAGVDKMNAIQYGAQAGVQGEIASGKALKNVYGKDLKGGVGMSYADTAEANATMQNLGVAAEGAANKAIITDAAYQQLYGSKKANATVSKAQELGSGKANQKYLDENGGIDGVASLAETSTDAQNIKNTSTTQSLRDEFGDVAGGTGKGNYADTTYQLAKKSHKSSKGEAKAIKKLKGNTIEDMAESKANQDYGSFESSVKAIMDSDGISRDEAIAKMNSANISDNATKSLKGAISFDAKKDLGIVNEDGSINLDKELAYATKDKNGKISEHTGKYGDALRSQVSLNAGSEIGETMKTPDTANANAEELVNKSLDNLTQNSPAPKKDTSLLKPENWIQGVAPLKMYQNHRSEQMAASMEY